ncbi:HRDC domain-containing protein [Demequina oxidasica]|uniref:HRDC domain-containing protein n=1 Tax=Demequina oxidasica TaxID=676199 RepID=UPI0007863868|nr:HRDC domain-containing protein [Demequina oxidasica]
MSENQNDAPDAESTLEPDAEPATPLTMPADGVPPVIDTPEALAEAAARFAQGTGPVAADAERASGFRYGQATYLVQFKREGAGLILIDAGVLTDLSTFGEALGDAEWIFHAASQDLPGMHDLGMYPSSIFDTELAARLLGWPKVGLAAVVERELGLALAKEHSAQDWSTRPLPHSWLVYAALDVEILIELRNGIHQHLVDAGKLEWAEQEFEAVRLAPPAAPRVDPWRRTSGSHQIRDPRGLAIVKSLWEARDREAQRRDTSPGRVLRDAAITAAGQAKPTSFDELVAIREWQSKGTRRRAREWYAAVEEAMALPEKKLPPRRGPSGDGPPQPRMWKDKRPDAAIRLTHAREAIQTLVDEHSIPAENLLQPDAMRRTCWEFRPSANVDTEAWIREFQASRGARQWQIDLTAPVLAAAFESAAAESEAVAALETDA